MSCHRGSDVSDRSMDRIGYLAHRILQDVPKGGGREYDYQDLLFSTVQTLDEKRFAFLVEIMSYYGIALEKTGYGTLVARDMTFSIPEGQGY